MITYVLTKVNLGRASSFLQVDPSCLSLRAPCIHYTPAIDVLESSEDEEAVVACDGGGAVKEERWHGSRCVTPYNKDRMRHAIRCGMSQRPPPGGHSPPMLETPSQIERLTWVQLDSCPRAHWPLWPIGHVAEAADVEAVAAQHPVRVSPAVHHHLRASEAEAGTGIDLFRAMWRGPPGLMCSLHSEQIHGCTTLTHVSPHLALSRGSHAVSPPGRRRGATNVLHQLPPAHNMTGVSEHENLHYWYT